MCVIILPFYLLLNIFLFLQSFVDQIDMMYQYLLTTHLATKIQTK